MGTYLQPYLQSYNGFDLFDNRTAEYITNFPISVVYHGQFVEACRDIDEAKQKIDHPGEWYNYIVSTTHKKEE